MKTIGLIGGITYVSTIEYYKLMNEMANQKLGYSHSASVIIFSLDFEFIKNHSIKLEWNEIEKIVTHAALQLEKAGAECIVIGANTIHQVAKQVAQNISIPIIHIVEETIKAISLKGLKKVALLGTKYTMQLPFYREMLNEKNIEVIIPNSTDIEIVNQAIYNEMSKGIFTKETKDSYLRIMNKLKNQGAEGIILGCTEIPLLINDEDIDIPLFNTTKIHSQAAIDFACK
jgi:aspartate racemase